jgi:hypothetical protein
MIPFEKLLLVNDALTDRTWVSEPDFGQTPWKTRSKNDLFYDPGDHAIEITGNNEIDGMAGVTSDHILQVD